MTNRLPHQNLTLTARMTFAIGGKLHANGWTFMGLVDQHGELTDFGQRIAAGQGELPTTRETLEYARLVGLVDTLRDELFAAIDSSDRPTLPPQPTCHHTDGMCEHMVCPRELAADPHFTPEYYRRFGW